VRKLCREYLAAGYNHFKMKVGKNIEDDVRRAAVRSGRSNLLRSAAASHRCIARARRCR
jgi:hypothetical protein